MKKIFSSRKIIIPLILCICSCSLKYEEGKNIEDKMPELIFTNAELNRYNDGNRSMQLKAEQLEQYKDNGSAYARNPVFSTWTTDKKLDTTGRCNLLSVNSKEDIYTLFSEIPEAASEFFSPASSPVLPRLSSRCSIRSSMSLP